MFSQFRKAARALRVPSIAEREEMYLNEAGDRYDLELREREVARGAFRGRNSF